MAFLPSPRPSPKPSICSCPNFPNKWLLFKSFKFSFGAKQSHWLLGLLWKFSEIMCVNSACLACCKCPSNCVLYYVSIIISISENLLNWQAVLKPLTPFFDAWLLTTFKTHLSFLSLCLTSGRADKKAQEIPTLLSAGSLGHTWKPSWRPHLNHRKNPKSIFFLCSLKTFWTCLEASPAHPESLIMQVVNLFILAWYVCSFVSLDTWTRFGVGVPPVSVEWSQQRQI